MAVFRHTEDLPPEARGCSVAIGNFDGVHRGHRAVLAEAQAHAKALGTQAAVLTFEPHPRQVFQPEAPPFRLSSLRTKTRLLESLGMAHLFVRHFDSDFARIDADSFVTDILLGHLAARHIVIGADFRFGHKRGGDADRLRQRAAPAGVGVSALPPVHDAQGEVVSSSRIRGALRDGDPLGAAELLGRPWEVEGRVEPGAQRGRDIGFPTANLRLGAYLEPRHGIYAVRAGIDRGAATVWWDGVAYIGRRPVVAGEDVLLEVYVFDASPDLYGEHLRVRMIDFIRPDGPFESLETLKTQIVADCAAARDILARTPAESARPAAGWSV